MNILFPKMGLESSLFPKDSSIFVDRILLPAIDSICPVQAQNFGVSARADVERLRNKKGAIIPKPCMIPSVKLAALVDKMRSIIQGGGDDLAMYAGFFFDTWAIGVKQPLLERIEDTLLDIEWSKVKQDLAFVDVGSEVLPSEGNGLVAIPLSQSMLPFMKKIFGDSFSSKTCSTRLVIDPSIEFH